MKTHVLVTYGSKYGATAEIAEMIGKTLRDTGLSVDVAATRAVRNLHVYRVVILGSAVYIGQWRKDAALFLRTHEEILAGQWVWLFSTGPTGEGDPVDLTKGWYFPESLKPIADRIKPKDIAVFHGTLVMKKMNFFEKWIIKKVKAPMGDFRDWNVITAWARSIADVLKENGLAG
jgi:menaquinone-dependent protoporphyrinogen oxidase